MSRSPHRRLQKELERLHADPVEGVEVSASEDLMEWQVQLQGQGIYEGEAFTLRFAFSRNDPLESPEVVFVGAAPVHPHVYSNGHICLSILYQEWSPALTVRTVSLSILSMLSSCEEKVPPPDDESYSRSARNRSPKKTLFAFHDDNV